MSDTVEQLMESNLLHVFNEPDFDKRAVAIGNPYSPQVRWTDDEGVSVGHDALNDPELFVIGLDEQVYGQKFDKSGNPVGGYFFTQPGAVKVLAVTP